MLSIKINKISKIEIKKSKFISYSYRLENLEDENKYLLLLKSKYKDASHICFAWKFDNYQKFSDDNEPVNCASKAIMNIIDKNKLDHVLIVVIRYFGGIKLGASGLFRAYSESALQTIKDNIITLSLGYLINIIIPYDKENIIKRNLDSKDIIVKEYQEKIKLIVKGDNNFIQILDNNHIDYKIIKNMLIEKE